MSFRAAGSSAAGGRADAYKSKSLFKQDELRRRREEAQVEIRKQKREESMAKRRNMNLTNADLTDGETDDEEAVGAALDGQVGETDPLEYLSSVTEANTLRIL